MTGKEQRDILSSSLNVEVSLNFNAFSWNNHYIQYGTLQIDFQSLKWVLFPIYAISTRILGIPILTLRKVQKIRVILRGSENTFSLLQWLSIFPVYLKMDLMFTDFPTGSGSPPCAVLEICKYLMHP